ncbi:hypothetical protein NMY22_g4733 [Coprinellus aureogranulatus]|nr:hypothetical protein NMY22_g4733 [Coprinellus aureogranulatus]
MVNGPRLRNSPPHVYSNNASRYYSSNHNQEFHQQGDIRNITNNSYGGEQDKYLRALQKLETKISRGAAHNSAERSQWYTPKCHEGTRKAVQDDMLSWIARGKEKALWLTGPAGAGKSAIAGSIADRCHHRSRKWLAGSFFFWGVAAQPDRYLKGYLFPTLAYHFTHLDIPGLREEILLAIDTCPSVFDRNLDEQLDTLILEPLRKVGQGAIQSSTFKTVVIDGVDECKGGRAKSRRRPERAIERYFSSLPSGAFKHIFLGDIYNPTADIELYLRAKFDTIGRNHDLPDQWYHGLSKEDAPRYLAQEASGQFIYAAIVIRYVQDGKVTPHEQLKRVLNWQGVKSSRPFAALDALYAGILKDSPDPPTSAMWIHAIKDLQAMDNRDDLDLRKGGKGGTYDSCYIKAFMESSPGQTEVVLGRLTALVGLSDKHGQPAFIFYHKSLNDFLDDENRSGELHLELEERKQFLRERYYQVLKNRGPQGYLPPDLQEFYRMFWLEFRFCIDRNRQYDASDVGWWIGLPLDPVQLVQLVQFDVLECISDMFRKVHRHVSNLFNLSGFPPGS